MAVESKSLEMLAGLGMSIDQAQDVCVDLFRGDLLDRDEMNALSDEEKAALPYGHHYAMKEKYPADHALVADGSGEVREAWGVSGSAPVQVTDFVLVNRG